MVWLAMRQYKSLHMLAYLIKNVLISFEGDAENILLIIPKLKSIFGF